MANNDSVAPGAAIAIQITGTPPGCLSGLRLTVSVPLSLLTELK